MTSIGIMQPYVFPYIGYFQLIQAVDLFVLYDDVHYIKKGWINRNRILLNGQEHLFTIPCKDPSQNRLICETEIALDIKTKEKLLGTFVNAYRKAPYFKDVMPMIEDVIGRDYKFIHEMAGESIKAVCSFLSLHTAIKSSKIYDNQALKREQRLIDICKIENLHQYINAEGGKEIYTKEYFATHGISLSFIKSKPVIYNQMNEAFVPWLSIIDVLMFNNTDEVKELLKQYELT